MKGGEEAESRYCTQVCYIYCEQVNARLGIALRSRAPLRNAPHALARYCGPGLKGSLVPCYKYTVGTVGLCRAV